MPLWYENHWQALLLLQALLGVFPFSYSLRRRRHFLPRLALGLGGGMLAVELLTRLFFARGLVAEFSVITMLYVLLSQPCAITASRMPSRYRMYCVDEP